MPARCRPAPAILATLLVLAQPLTPLTRPAGAAPTTVATTPDTPTPGITTTRQTATQPAGAPLDLPFTAAEIEAATYPGGDLPAGRSALTAKVQVLLDRAGVSPGVIDGFKGGMSMTAISAYQRKMGLPVNGIMNHHVWAGLQQYAGQPVTQPYIITAADAEGLVAAIPADYAEKAKMGWLGYTSVTEKLAERFHMDDRFLRFLNPGKTITPGETITVMAPARRLRATVTRIIIDKEAHRVAAYDASGRLVVDYPATIGSTATPSPSGDHMVTGVALNPEYTYNPAINFKQGDNDRPLRIPAGPNGPVGSVWIDLDRPTYGIHGTPTPSQLFVNQSHGCVRLTNWDAEELAHMVRANLTEVLFLDAGKRIADLTETVTAPIAITATRPRPRPATAPTVTVAAGADTAAPDPAVEEVVLPDALRPLETAQPAADTTPVAVETPSNAAALPDATAAATPQTGAPDPLHDALERVITPTEPAPDPGTTPLTVAPTTP